MLGQIDIEWWHVLVGGIVLLIASGTKACVTIISARAKERREALRDDAQTEFLKNIASTNGTMSVNIATLNERLLAERELHRTMHAQNLERIQSACRYGKPKLGEGS